MTRTRDMLVTPTMSGRAGRGVLVVACGVVLAGCGGGQPSQPATADDPRGQVRELLRDRARALAAGDVDAYLEPVADGARDVETTFAEGAMAAPLAQLSLSLADADVDRAVPAVRDATVDVVYRYEGMPDDNPLRAQLTVDFAAPDGDWQVTAAAVDEPAPVWATGPMQASRSDHFWVVSRPGVDHQPIIERAEAAFEEVTAAVDVPVDPVHVLVLARDADEFAALAGPDRPAHATAVATWQFRTSGMAGQARAQHRQMLVNLNPAQAGVTVDHHGTDDTRPREVFAHELAHLVLHRFTSPHTPRWVVEAGAMYLAGERRTDGWQAGVAREAFADRSFAEMDDELDSVDYAYANAAAHYLADQHDQTAFVEFYRSFRDADSTDDADRILTHVYGFGLDALDRHTREWIHDTLD